MDELFQAIINDVQDLESLLINRIPTFSDLGAVYLITDNSFTNEEVLRVYTEHCKLNLKSEDIPVLQSFYRLYRHILSVIASEMKIDEKKEVHMYKLLRESVTPDGRELIEEFAFVHQKVHQYLTEVVSYLLHNYSLKVVPNKSIQEYIMQNIKGFVPNEFSISMAVDTQGLLENARPNLQKFIAQEKKNNTLSLDISVETELINITDIFENGLNYSMENELIGDVVTTVSKAFYTDIYKFAYEQLNQNKISVAEVLKNIKNKFPDAKNNFTQALIEEGKKRIEEYKTIISQKDLAQYFSDMKILLADINENLVEKDFFDYEFPRIYRLNFRECTKFETENYNSFFALDVYSYPDLTFNQEVLFSSATLALAPSIYRATAVSLCGTDHNAAFIEQILFKNKENSSTKLIADMEEGEAAEVVNYQNLTDNLSDLDKI